MNYIIDGGHTLVEFSARHLMISNVKGTLGNASGTVDFDIDQPNAAFVDVTIDVNSLTTHNQQRDRDLKGSEFLDTDKYPTITFRSTKVEKTGETDFVITGDLTIHGITQTTVLQAEYQGESKDHFGNNRVGFSAKANINRKDFGLTLNMILESGVVVIGDKISITLEVELIQQESLVAAR